MSQAVPPVLSVQPSRALVDEKFSVQVENLPPGCPVTVRSLYQSEDKDFWEAYGHYVSDHRGTVSVSEDVSLGGTYTGKEQMGLIWSMRPAPGSREGLRLRKRDMCTPMLVTISVYRGHEDFRDQTALASALVERWHMAPGVQRIEVRERGVQGTLFVPPGPGPFPALLDLWGGGGGLQEYRAALLASRGFAALALEYLKADDSKPNSPGDKYFETAFEIIRAHPQVAPDRVGIIGLCFGTLVALSLAAEYPMIKPRCIVCLSNVHHKSRKNTVTEFPEEVPERFKTVGAMENVLVWRDMGLAVLKMQHPKIPVGNIDCPMLLINGTDDQNWPTVEVASDIIKMMREAGKESLVTRVDYPGAGHLIEPPFSPLFRATNFMLSGTRKKVMMLWGGKTKPHADAQEDSWRRILSFLQLHLYGDPSPKAKL
ncbi:acyl-coenzyme A thioesterase 1 [Oryzias melastigma]|uniref:Acyl-CoA thioesterase 17 n=1 Tax=Oryzias melastigma TaxID=30732 RepID=A0A3B3CVP4_ORYME|nr:acyl-coenzyme A thioesterase 1 [Oryzias melastigma]XP_024148116.1 acyl-coenzyme A thioesterase 1 [Oryzias melastigma]